MLQDFQIQWVPEITVQKFWGIQVPLAPMLTQALEAVVVYTTNANPLSIKGLVAKVRACRLF